MSPIKKASKSKGLPPGTPIYIGKETQAKVTISLIDYDEKNIKEKSNLTLEEVFALKDTSSLSWININGLNDVDSIEKIGQHFGLHPLTIEDIVNTSQRPKYEDFDKYIFAVFKMLMFDEQNQEVVSEQVSLILGKNFVISIQEKEGDVFEPIRDRLRKAKGRIRKAGSDYLAYCLFDMVIDNHFSILEKLGEKIESMEDEIIANPAPKTLQTIHKLKQDIIFLRKSVWPLREVVNALEREESNLIKKETRIFLRDLYDHTIQVIDTIESYRDMVSGMLDVFLSSISNKMNEVMKVLTIFAAIFIPLTFIAGIYGMNFENIPELKWPYGYFGALGLMATVALGMLFYFRKKNWL